METQGEILARQIEAEQYDLEALMAEADQPPVPPREDEQRQHEALERAIGPWQQLRSA
jgi:hypothetical protein